MKPNPVFSLLLLAATASAQLVTTTTAVPKKDKPPVVFVNGYQIDCGTSSFRGTFGSADTLLQADGRVSLFFDNCAAGRVSLESLGNRLGEFLRDLRYEDGQAVPQVDVVAHSMGGLIVRSYLAGKQPEEGVFLPPVETKIRKLVFLATPHFGTSVIERLAPAPDVQITALQLGSAFIFDLAMWNQGVDDLRGVDAISVLGDAGNGLLVGISGFDDPVTSLTSGSLGFALPDRTRIVGYCHTDGIVLANCVSGAPAIAQMNSTAHLPAQILLSFLNGTDTWRTIGRSVQEHPQLSSRAGLILRYRDAMNRPQMPNSAQASAGIVGFRSDVIFGEYLPIAQPLQLTLGFPTGNATLTVPLAAGSTRAAIAKNGPNIAAIYPSASIVFPRAVAPGSLISVYGSEFGSAPDVFVDDQQMSVTYASPDQINTFVPDNVSGLVRLRVRTGLGEHTVNLLIEPVVPSIFAPALNALTGALVTPQSPLRPGEYVSLYLTGLGATRQEGGLEWAVVRPEVVFGGQPCQVLYAGRAPGFPGLDQINCQLSTTLQPNDAAPVVVRSGARTSNVTTLAVR